MLCASGMIRRTADPSLSAGAIYGIMAFLYGDVIGNKKHMRWQLMPVCAITVPIQIGTVSLRIHEWE